MNNKGSCLLFAVIGIVLIIGAVVLVIYNFNETREQIAEKTAFIDILSDYFVRYIIAIILTAIGTTLVFLGVKK